MRKKAQIYGSIIPLIVLMAIASLMVILFSSLTGNLFQSVESDLDDIANNFIINATKTSRNDTGVLLNMFVQEGTLHVYNGTLNKTEIALGNFTIDYSFGTLQTTSDGSDLVPNGSSIYVSYYWGANAIRNGVKESAVSSFEAQETTASYLSLIALGVVIFIVITLVLSLSLFGGSRNMGGGTPL